MNQFWWRGGEASCDIPQWAYRHLVVNLRIDPNQLTHLECVERYGLESGTVVHYIRIFSPTKVGETIEIRDFTALDQHPELILHEGYMELKSGEVFMFY